MPLIYLNTKKWFPPNYFPNNNIFPPNNPTSALLNPISSTPVKETPISLPKLVTGQMTKKSAILSSSNTFNPNSPSNKKDAHGKCLK